MKADSFHFREKSGMLDEVPDSSNSCAYCGLPLAEGKLFGQAFLSGIFSGSAKTAEPFPPSLIDRTTTEPSYCCSGCRFAASIMGSRGAEGEARRTLTYLVLSAFFAMNVMVFSMVLWTGDVYELGQEGSSPLVESFHAVLRYLCLLFTLPVLAFLGGPLAVGAWRNLCRGAPSTDVLLISGVIAAVVYSTICLVRNAGHVYFEVACVVLVMVTLGRWLEAEGKLRATTALDALGRLLPETVVVLRGDTEEKIPLDQVETGDRLRIRAGERIPADGTLEHGTATVDQQLLTGESSPIDRRPGDNLLGGTLNLDGDLVLNVLRNPREGTLSRLIEAVRQARLAKGKYQRLADRVSYAFLPVLCVVACLNFLFHLHSEGLEAALMSSLAVVLIACPCALGLATPMAIWAALGRAAQAQVLFRGGASLERLAGVRAIVFDKTGTLTTGTAKLSALYVEQGENEEEVLQQALTLASASSHPLSLALLREYPGQKNLRSEFAIRTIPGRGVWATRVDELGNELSMGFGSSAFLVEQGMSFGEELSSRIAELGEQQLSLACIGWRGKIRGLFSFQEELRPEAIGAINNLMERGLRVEVLTGDRKQRAEEIARQFKVRVKGDLLPEEKSAELKTIRHLWGSVAMVGDGVNDAPALAESDVGIALGCGTDVSRQTAGVCLLGNDLRRVTWSLELARKTGRVVRQNLFWAFAYNVAGVGLACAGLLNPIWASLAMVLSSFLVIGNSLRLNRFPLDIELRGMSHNHVVETDAVKMEGEDLNESVLQDRDQCTSGLSAHFLNDPSRQAHVVPRESARTISS